MSEKELNELAFNEMLRDWRFWVTYLLSVHLGSLLLVSFFQVESLIFMIVIIFGMVLLMDRILKNHYVNVIAAERGIKRD